MNPLALRLAGAGLIGFLIGVVYDLHQASAARAVTEIAIANMREYQVALTQCQLPRPKPQPRRWKVSE